MRILLVSSYLPYPLYAGGEIRLYNLLKRLAKNHTITLICEKRNKQTAADIAEVKKFCKKVITVDRKKQWTIKNVLKTGISTKPFLLTGHTHPEMKALIAKELEENTFDIIHVETFYVLQNVPETKIPIVLVEHNIEYLVYKRFVDKASFALRPLLSFDILKLKREEEKSWDRVTRLVAVSEIEKQLMQRADVAVVPNGVDLVQFNEKNIDVALQRKKKKVLFIGDFRWIQNQDSAKWIISEIWPKIQQLSLKEDLAIELWIVGRTIPENIKQLGKDNTIVFDEHATQATSAIFQEADLLLAPIRIGGGTQYKILESMAVGTPVVTTPLSANALGAKNQENIFAAETAEDLVKQVVAVLTDRKVYKTISTNARKFVEEKYSWETITRDLEDVYKSV